MRGFFIVFQVVNRTKTSKWGKSNGGKNTLADVKKETLVNARQG